MLFLPQSVYDARASLWRDVETGTITGEQAYRRMLDLDPDDYIGLIGLGRLREVAGDLAAAEQYFRQAIQAHPCIGQPYIELARLLYRQPESAALALALAELGIGKGGFDDEGLDFQKAGLGGKTLAEFKKLDKATEGQLISMSMRAEREHEPETVTERMRHLRLLQQMHEDGDLDRETVDAIIGEGESIAPLLVGVLRDWAQDLLGDEDDPAVENALGLLGETGSASEIPHLLEFVDLDHEDAAGAAAWALGRIVERHTAESAQFIASLSAGLGASERTAVAEQILHHPGLDPAGKLLERLSQNIEPMTKEDRDALFPALLGTMAAARGQGGVSLGFKVLRQQGSLLSRSTRRECEALLTALQLEGVSAVPMEPSPVTVYEICEGNAIWDTYDDDEEEEYEDDEPEEEFLPAPEPVRRRVTPGRNDPCWCNSGKKYKKCHLESDERARHAPRERSAVSLGSNEFEGLRKSIGEFLGQVLTDGQKKLALEEFLGDRLTDEEDATVSLTDWIVHDWIAPSLGRTVMEEFLVRRGSRITDREREMVEAWSRSFAGLYEVQDLTAGVGLKLKDLIFGETFFVHDVSMSTQLARWDGLMTRVVPGERGTELAGTGLTVPRHGIEPLREWMEEDRRNAGLEWREYLKGNWPRIRRRSFEIAANAMDSLRLANSDGEELLFSKAVYRITNEAAAIAALRNYPAFHDEDGQAFVWLDERQTVIGNIRIGGGELVLECNSRQRMERGKLLLSDIAGKSLRHLRDEFTTQKELKNRAAAGRPGDRRDEREMPREVRDEVARYLEDHYRKWLDMKLPALDGDTPRNAANSVKGRKQVIAVLKDIENGEDRKRQAGQPFYDVNRLRVELGLDS